MFKVGDKVIVEDGEDNGDHPPLEKGSVVEITGVYANSPDDIDPLYTINVGEFGKEWLGERFRLADPAADPFIAFVEENRDTLLKGMRMGIARYTLAPLTPTQMASITVALLMTCKWYTRLGKDVPVSELRSFLDKLTEDPA